MAKPSKQSTSIAKQSTQALARPMEDFEIELMKEAKDEAAKETIGMPRIDHNQAGLKIDGKKVDGGKLTVAVIDYVFSKHYFKEKFQPSVSATPTCYAYGLEEGAMKPHDQARGYWDVEKEEFVKPATCAQCPCNAFGTAEMGRGKRCSDVRKLAVIIGSTTPAGVPQAEVRSLSIPPGSLKFWGKYLKALPDFTASGNVRTVLTEVIHEPAEQAYILQFRFVDKLAPEMVKALMTRRERARADLMQPWPTIEEQETKPQPRRKVKGQ